MPTPMLVPELDVTDLEVSLHFYRDVVGFRVKYQRPAEQFAYLECDGAELMLQQAEGSGRRFRTAPLERPFGRGINLQIEVADVDSTNLKVLASKAEIVLGMEEKWYSLGNGEEAGNRQFVVADPDGYLLRLFTDLGSRPETS